MSRSDAKERGGISRRSLLGGALAATLLAAASPTLGRLAQPAVAPDREKPRLPVWIGHI